MLQKILLFLSSYSPVFVLLAFQVEWSDNFWLSVLLLAIAALGLAGLAFILALTFRKPVHKVRIASRQDAGAESAAFLAGYLLPLITANLDTAYAVGATTIYIVLACVITVRSSLIQVNPVLLLLGYKIIRTETTIESFSGITIRSGYLVTRRDVLVGDEIFVRRFGGDVFLFAGRDEQ